MSCLGLGLGLVPLGDLEPLAIAAGLVEALHARDDGRERLEPLVELLVELLVRRSRAARRVRGELGVEIGAVRARLHRDLQ